MSTYLLYWNRASFPWADFHDKVRIVRGGGILRMKWSCVNQNIQLEDRVFLIRQGEGTNCVIASGRARSRSFKDLSYDPTLAMAMIEIAYVSVDIDILLDPWAEDALWQDNEVLSEKYWNLEGSGKLLPSDEAERLENAWRAFLDQRGLR